MSLENLPSWRLYDGHHDNDPPIPMLTLCLTIHLWLASTFPPIYRIFFLLEIAPKLLSTTKPNCFPCKLIFHPLFITLQMHSNHDITILFLSFSISHHPPRNASLAPKSHVFFLLGQHILINASLDLSNTYFFFPSAQWSPIFHSKITIFDRSSAKYHFASKSVLKSPEHLHHQLGHIQILISLFSKLSLSFISPAIFISMWRFSPSPQLSTCQGSAWALCLTWIIPSYFPSILSPHFLMGLIPTSLPRRSFPRPLLPSSALWVESSLSIFIRIFYAHMFMHMISHIYYSCLMSFLFT